MSTDARVVLSPSKVTALANYFMHYPDWPLRRDVLVDLLLYPQLTAIQTGIGQLWLQRDIEQRRWKRVFERICADGAIEVVPGSNVDSARIMRVYEPLRQRLGTEKPMDLAIFALFAQERELPLIYHEREFGLFSGAETAMTEIFGRTSASRGELAPSTDRPHDQIAQWSLKMLVPRLFAERAAKPGDEWPDVDPAEEVWIDPDHLAEILRDTSGLRQFREHMRGLATADPAEATSMAKIAAAQRARDTRLQVANLIFEGIDLGLMVVPGDVAAVMGLLTKGVRPLTTWALRHPFRWLYMTEKINSAIADGAPPTSL